MKIIISAFALIILIAGLTSYLLPPQTPLSPLGVLNQTDQSHDSDYLILGFAPYWNLKKISDESLRTITHFAYFALHLDEGGSLYTKVNSNEEDPGYTNYKRLLSNPISSSTMLTYMQKDQNSLIELLSTQAARAQAIETIINTTTQANAIGVNIDFEPIGEIPRTLRNDFTLFINELKQQTCPSTKSTCPLLTVSVYPSAASKPRLWDLKELNMYVDYFVIMTYDYTLPKSPKAGPNAPLRDFSGEFEHNIIKNLTELTQLLPAHKILLGIPLYGYEWDTVDATRYSPTESRGVTASLERIEAMLKEKTIDLLWDRNSLTPYGISTNSGSVTQIYFENEASIRLKLDLVKSAGLGGVALWALGYDNGVTWLWPTLKSLN